MLLSFGFLWLASLDNLTAVGLRFSSGWTTFVHFRGGFCFAAGADVMPYGIGQNAMFIHEHGTAGTPDYIDWWQKVAARGLVLRHWALALVFLVLWGAWLAFRWRQLKNIEKETPSS